MEKHTTEALARSLIDAFDAKTQMDPLTLQHPDLSSSEAYEIADAMHRIRLDRGEALSGWKIGFTNRTIWDDYGVHAPIWGPMYSNSTDRLTDETWSVSHLNEPKIEAEIAFRFSHRPSADSDERDLLESIDAVCHGFEFVQSPFPDWRFRPVDTMAAAGLHGSFCHGPWHSVTVADRGSWLAALSDFTITLRSDHGTVDVGHSKNVLGGPLSALRYFVSEASRQSPEFSIEPGQIVTTGTVPKAYPVRPGQRWWTEVEGLPIAGLSVTCA